ncbi:hypothetical protein [Streptomyces sp. NBC_00096]|uniref:hypothetical protein n=1 Tax=Streptomyces sp. NBC_00096 TaxID=2975650 RepID=UPI00324F5F9E
MTTAIRESADHRRPKSRRERPQWREWRGWTGAAPFWLNSALLLLTPFADVTLFAQIGIIAALAATGGLARHLWSGDYGHPAIHTAAVLMGAAAVAFVVL